MPTNPPSSNRVLELTARAYRDVGTAAEDVLEVLHEVTGMGLTYISRAKPDRYALWFASDQLGLGIRAGRVVDWEATYCQRVLDGRAPTAMGDARNAPEVEGLDPLGIGAAAYLSLPVRGARGELLATLCALHPEPVRLDAEHLALVDVLAGLLARELSLESLRQVEHEMSRRAMARAALRRRHLARRLHDEAIQPLVAARLLLDVPERDAVQLQRAREIITEATQMVHSLLIDLDPGHLGDLDMAEELTLRARRRSADADIDISIPPGLVESQPATASALLQISGELLANVDDHAEGRLVALRAEWFEGSAAIEVEDAGPGGCAAAEDEDEEGLGLGIVRMVAASFSGHVEIHDVNPSAPRPGTLVRVLLPDADI